MWLCEVWPWFDALSLVNWILMCGATAEQSVQSQIRLSSFSFGGNIGNCSSQSLEAISLWWKCFVSINIMIPILCWINLVQHVLAWHMGLLNMSREESLRAQDFLKQLPMIFASRTVEWNILNKCKLVKQSGGKARHYALLAESSLCCWWKEIEKDINNKSKEGSYTYSGNLTNNTNSHLFSPTDV